MFVPVVDKDQNPLMPTTSSRARKWIKSRKASPFWRKGIFCVRLNKEPSDNKKQDIVVGIDPGSKREAFTVKSEHHTYCNIEAEAVDGNWIKKKIEARKNLRRSRRNRKTPCRPPRWLNRKGKFIPPSTKARWQWKLRIINWLKTIIPINLVVVEDVCAKTVKGNGGRWNISFSRVQQGKNWFYDELEKIFRDVFTVQGYETKELRDTLGLKKSENKLSGKFDAHIVDSWVMANSIVGGHIKVDNMEIIYVKPLKKYYRQLHVMNFAKGAKRKKYGSTRSLGFTRGSIVKHPKYGVCLVGGTSGDRISLHNRKDGKRLCRNAKPLDVRFLSYNSILTK